MSLLLALLAVLIGTPDGSDIGATPMAAVPAEPRAIVLPAARTLEAVVVDLDDDGSREVVRLVRGNADALEVEAWALERSGWSRVGEPLAVVPPRGGLRTSDVYAEIPVRLLVRRADGRDRLTVATQPRFEELDAGPACCLVLQDVIIADGSLRPLAVMPPSEAVEALLVLDLDGDGTDEVLTTRSLPPAGDVSYPTEARVYRWTAGEFLPPRTTTLPIGSGDTPFILGDSDGRPGEEAAILSTLGPPGLFRVSMAAKDELVVDRFRVTDAGAPVLDAVAAPVAAGRGVAVTGGDEVGVYRWPAGSEPSAEAVATARLPGAELLGVVRMAGDPRLLVRQRATSALHVLGLPNLTPPPGGAVTHSPAAASLESLPAIPYVGPLPRGGADGEAAILYAGRLLPDPRAGRAGMAPTAAPASTLAGARPIGLAARRDWIALLHVPAGDTQDRRSGRFVAPVPLQGAWLSIAPFDQTLEPERGDGRLEPPIRNATPIGPRGILAIGRSGFFVKVRAPVGSRILTSDLDPSVVRAPLVIPASGELEVPVVPPAISTPNPRYRATLIVTTPAGRGYVSAWDVQVLTDPPSLEISASTPFGSPQVEVSGVTAPYARVTVGGRTVNVTSGGRFLVTVGVPPLPTDVTVIATDPAGNATRADVSAVGLFDYRRLPWIPIVVGLVGIAGAVLYLRVPRMTSAPRRADDDAALEEMETE